MAYIRGGKPPVHLGHAEVMLSGPIVVARPSPEANAQLETLRYALATIKKSDEDQLAVQQVFTQKFLDQTMQCSPKAVFAGTEVPEGGGIKVDSAKWTGQRVAAAQPWRLCLTSPMETLTEDQVGHFKKLQEQNTTIPLAVQTNMFVLKVLPEHACRGNVLAASGAVAAAPETMEAFKRLRSAAGLPELPVNPPTSTLPEYVPHISIFQFTPKWLPGMLESLQDCPDAAMAEVLMNAMNFSLKRFWQGFHFSQNELFLNDVQVEHQEAAPASPEEQQVEQAPPRKKPRKASPGSQSIN